MTDFHDIDFPWHLAFGASGGPQRETDIVRLGSGAEARNTRKQYSRRRYVASVNLKSKQQAIEIISFFEARFGRLYSFRFRDSADHSSSLQMELITPTDQTLAISDGAQTDFQLQKTYPDPINPYTRPITKPKSGSVKIAVNGSEVSVNDYTIDHLTGGIIFASAPPAQSVITAGFEFDVPVRFDMEQLNVSLDDFEAAQIVDLSLVEVMDHV